MSPLRRLVAVSLACATVSASLVAWGSAARASGTPAVTLTTSASTVAPGSRIDLTASVPVRDDTGPVAQEIVQVIDPTKVRLTSVSDITYPTGWTLSFCSAVNCDDTSNFSPAVPANATAWSAVRAVRATGTVNSQGADAGRQVATSTPTGSSVNLTTLNPSVSGANLDGFQAFFDANRTRVFNLYHHSSASFNPLDCWVIATGARCAGFPYGGVVQTEEQAIGVVVGSKIWIQGADSVVCVDISLVLANATNAPSGGSPRACTGGALNASGKLPITSGSLPYGRFTNFAGVSALGSAAERRLWTVDGNSDPVKAFCIDTATMTTCGSITTNITGKSTERNNSVLWGNRLYINAPGQKKAICYNVDTSALCAGWSGAYTSVTGSQKLVELPSAAGGVRAVCLIGVVQNPPNVPTGFTNYPCWDEVGTQFNASTVGFPMMTTWEPSTVVYATPVRKGSRLFVGNGMDNYNVPGALCYDAAANGGAGGRCNGATADMPINNYTVTPDPILDNCLWVAKHSSPVISRMDMPGTTGCSTPLSRLVFSGSTAVPRMGCSATSAVAGWRTFTLNTPSSGYTSAKLTVRDSSGAPIEGWTSLTVTQGASLALTSLTTSMTGQSPDFVVDFIGASGSLSASASITAVGDAPQVCLKPLAVAQCPTSVVVDPMALVGAVTTIAARASTNPGGALGDDSESVSISAPTSAQCGSTLTGRAGDASLGTGGSPVAGVVVELLDDTGNAVVDDSGNALTATTNASGAYSFGFLRPGTYKVRFPNAGSTASVSSATTASGGSSSDDTATKTASGGFATSGRAVLSVGTNGVVNGLYVVNPVARPNASTGIQGAVQTISPLADDSASTGANYSSGLFAVRLCDAGGVNCNSSSRLVPGQGQYAISGTNVTFTPCTGAGSPYVSCTGAFTGTATAVTYQSVDSLGRTGTSTITPTVVAAPVARDDTSTGAWNAVQTISPLVDDTAGVGTSLTASSVKLCTTATVTASCSGTTLTIANQGTYAVNASGVVTFTPLSSFTGTATPIKYVVSDALGQKASATITPSVTSPPSPTAGSETKLVLAGASVAFTTVTGAGGLGTSGGPPFITTNTTSATGLCPVGTVLPGQVSNCTSTSVTVTGQGTYTLNRTTGVVTYAALASATTGSKTPIQYVVRDGVTSGGRTDWASGTLTPVIPGPPVARDDTSAAGWDATQTVNVLGNDSADPGQSLVASSVRLCGAGDVSPACDDTTVTTAQGTFTVNPATGAVSFDPLPTFSGVATPITYTVTDSQGLKDPATVTFTVAAPGLPVAGDDTVLVGPGQVASFDPLMGSGGLSTSGGPALSSVCLWVSGACDADDTVVVPGGVYRLNPVTKVVTFTACTGAGTPDAACTGTLSGQPAPVSYRVTDAIGQTDTGVLTARVPAAPVSIDDTSLGEQGASQVIAPTGNDSAGDASAPIDPTSIKICSGAGPCTGTAPVAVSGGVYSVAPSTGLVTFTPDPSFVGTAPPLSYTVTDSLGRTSTATITPVVQPKPTPIAVTDSQSGPFGQSMSFSPLVNDSAGTDPGVGGVSSLQLDTSTLKLCSLTQTPTGCTQTSVTTADGTYTLAGTTVTFTGNVSFTGTATQPLQYQVSNSYQLSGTPGTPYTSSAYLIPTITVAAVAAVPDTASTPWNTPVSESVLADDTSGAPINAAGLRLCGPNDAGVCAQTSVSVTGQGTYDIVAGQVRFTPVAGFSGAATPVTYRTTDSLGRPVSSTFTPTVAPPNGPSASPDTASVVRGQQVAFTTLAESGPLVAPGVNSAGTNPVVDGSTCLLQPPANTACISGSTLVVPGQGTYEYDSLAGVVRFTADPSATPGPQTPVSYRVSDSLGLTATSTLTPIVYAPPVVQPKTRTDVVNADQVFNVLADDTHDAATTIAASSVRLCDGADVAPACTAISKPMPGYGEFTVDPTTGAITFNPDDTYVGGVPAITYSVQDGLGQRTSATITPTVVAMPAPLARNDTGSAASGSPVVLRPWTNDDTVTGTQGASVTNAVLQPTSVQLCGPGDLPLPGGAGCDDTTVTTADGTYVLDPATGEVTFTHAPGFTGTATAPVTYQITTDYTINSGPTQSSYASAQLIPTITASAPPPGGGGVTPTPTPTPTPSPSPGLDPVPEPDQGLGRPGEPVRVDPIGNDTPGQGQEFDEGSLRLCPAGSTPPDCTGLVVETDQGVWVVDPFTGVVQFTPVDGFKGKVEIPYVIETDDGDQVDSVITVWITGPPAATDDASTGRVDTPQTLTPLGNDAADAAPWVASTMRLCATGQTPPDCDATEVTTPDGVYRVDPATGKVIFTPAPGFTGDATPIQYQVADEAGQVARAWLRPRVAGGGDAQTGWLHVRKVITKGTELRTGQVKLVTVCTGEAGQTVKRTHVMDTDVDRDTWRVRVPAGMTCKVHERAHGAPTTPGLAPMWDSRRWQVGHSPSIDVGEKVPVGTATAIDRLILSAKGGCQVIAGELVGVAVGTCTVSWRVPDGSVTTRTKWTHTTARATRTGEGTLTRAIPITGGATTRVTFTNAYDARAHVVTRTVYVTDPCAPVPKIGPRLAGTDPGTCT